MHVSNFFNYLIFYASILYTCKYTNSGYNFYIKFLNYNSYKKECKLLMSHSCCMLAAVFEMVLILELVFNACNLMENVWCSNYQTSF